MTLHFDDWRKNYGRMSYEDQVAFYNKVAEDFPEQIDFHLPSWLRFFEYVFSKIGPFRVLEIGGWKGELAEEVFKTLPDVILRKSVYGGGQPVPTWHNYEISQEALTETVPTDPRYVAMVPNDYAWNIELPDADVFIASHTIEHIKASELEQMVDNLPDTVRFIAFESPLPASTEGNTWENYTGSHILEVGWKQVKGMLSDRGFSVLPDLTGHNPKEGSEVFVFERVR